MIRDDLDAVLTLPEFGPDTDNIDDGSNSSLRSSEVCKAPLDAGTENNIRNTDDRTAPLHIVCHTHGNVEAANPLIEADIHVDVRDSDDETPLINAVFWNLIVTAERFFGPGADVHARNLLSWDNTIHFYRNVAHRAAIPADTNYQYIDQLQVDWPGIFLTGCGW